ncbi:MAG TPA: hypothetical protein VIL99_18445 [Ignavibacteria bacterium]
MKKYSEGVIIGFALISLSVILYTIHFYIFKDPHHIFIYLLGDLAFLPIEVLLVSVVFTKIINDRDKKETLQKINMILGVFFPESGVELMKLFAQNDKNPKQFQGALLIQPEWTNKDYKNSIKIIKKSDYHLEFDGPRLVIIREFLSSKRNLFLTFLENPILIEHETFTDLILALSHAEQELSNREDVLNLPSHDHDHIVLDIERVHKLLFFEWLQYMNYLRKSYPFLYSFSVRTNPFDPNADVEIK